MWVGVNTDHPVHTCMRYAHLFILLLLSIVAFYVKRFELARKLRYIKIKFIIIIIVNYTDQTVCGVSGRMGECMSG